MDVVFSGIYLYLVFCLIGLGPAFLFFNKKFTVEEVFSYSPILGYLIICVLGVYLVLFDLPVELWANKLLIICSVVSVLFLKKCKISLDLRNKAVYLYLVGLFLVFILLNIPYIIGGLNFTIFRGNGTDEFNYLTMAGFLQHEPYSLLSEASFQELLNLHSSYPLAKELLNTRWATSMLLAYYSAISGLPLYRLDYVFSLFFFLMLYGVIFVFTQKLTKNNIILSFMIAIVLSTGFWAQLILDLRAMSFISILPALVLFSYVLVRDEVLDIKSQLGLSLIFCAIFYLYAEILPILALGVFLYLLNIFLERKNINMFKSYIFFVIFSLIFLFPTTSFIINFLKNQINIALSFKNNWHLAYFSWLYNSPLLGFWGAGPFKGYAKLSLFSLLGLILFIGFFIGLFFIYFRERGKNKYGLISASISLACLIGFLMLFLKEQYWAAGKLISYGYIFFTFVLVIGIFNHDWCFGKKVSKLFGKQTLEACLYIFIISQVIIAGMRIFNVYKHRDFSNYISSHGYYRQYDVDDKVFGLNNNLIKKHCSSIGINLNDSWLEEYFNFVFGWSYKIHNINGVHNRNNQIIGHQALQTTAVDCVLQRVSDQSSKSSKTISRNLDFKLILK